MNFIKTLLLSVWSISIIGCISKPSEKDNTLTDKEIARFDSLFNAWEKEISSNSKTKYSSNTQTYTTLPQFKELVIMGKKIIPCIIERFEKTVIHSLRYHYTTNYKIIKNSNHTAK